MLNRAPKKGDRLLYKNGGVIITVASNWTEEKLQRHKEIWSIIKTIELEDQPEKRYINVYRKDDGSFLSSWPRSRQNADAVMRTGELIARLDLTKYIGVFDE